MCGNTRPKLLEVSYGRTSQYNTAHSTKYRTHFERSRHSGFQTLDVEHRTDNRRTLDQPCTWHDGDRRRRAKTETDKDEDTLGMSEVAAPLQLTAPQNDEDGDRRRRRQTKTETDEDEDRLTLGTSEVAAPLQLTTPQNDEDGDRRRRRQTKTKTDSLWGRVKWQLS